MLKGFAQRQLSRGMLFGPLLVGVVYGLVQSLVPDWRVDFLYAQSPFVFTSLSGVAIAFACRPVLLRIDWSRGVAMALGAALVGCVGPLGDWVVSSLVAAGGLGAFPLNLPASGLSLLAAALVAGALMGHLFRPSDGALDARELWTRWRFHPWTRRLARLALIAAGAVAVWLLVAAGDAHLEESATTFYVPLTEPNYWLRLQGLWMNHDGTAAGGMVGALLGLLWLRAVLMLLPLVPIALAIRGSWAQLTLVFTVLLFVLSEFAPLMVDQPYPSLRWLVMRTALGLGRAFVVAALMTWLYGVVRRPGGPSATD